MNHKPLSSNFGGSFSANVVVKIPSLSENTITDLDTAASISTGNDFIFLLYFILL